MQSEILKVIHIYTDGGARGNPGPAALGVAITTEENKDIDGFGTYLGETTNNVAEYSAVVAALSWVIENKEKLTSLEEIRFYLDSQLVCLQIRGIYKMKSPNLRELLFKVREKEAEIPQKITYTHIPREQNKKADAYVNMALDAQV